MTEYRTAPLHRSALLRLDAKTGELKERRYLATVLTGPEAGRTVPVEGTVVVGCQNDCGIVVSDSTVSRQHLSLTAQPDGVHLTDLESTNGTFLQGARVERATIVEETVIGVGGALLRLSIDESTVDTPAFEADAFEGVVGRSPAMRQLFATLQRAAATQSTLVLLGETGTGKGMLARAIHRASERRDKPFVVIDCAAVAPSLVESELFGHVRGAFTGASASRDGAFIEADGGTVFLDELGELPLELQPRLLRVLEEGEVKRVGDDKPRKVDVRLIAATHRNLKAAVDEGTFREDLFYRLAVVLLKVPPLRERREDLPLLIERLAAELGKPGLALPAPLMAELTAHDWPGNVRELRNFVERVLAGAAAELTPKNTSGMLTVPALGHLPFKEAKEKLVDTFAREYLTGLLKSCNGNVSEVARRSGLARNYVHELLNRYGL